MSRFLFSSLLLFCLLPFLPGCGGSSARSDKETMAADPQHEEMMLRMAQATEQGGDLGAAERLYKGAATKSGSLEAHRELAGFYKRHHQDGAAVAALLETLKLHPGNTDVKRDLANTYIHIGAPDKALPVLDEALAADGKNAYLYNSKGVALDRLGRYGEARTCYETAITLNPAEAMTFKANLSMSWMLAGSPQKAVNILLPLLHAPDVTPTIRQNLAMAYGLEGRNDEALKLGLRDLSIAQAKENVKFYRMLAKTPKDSHKGPTQSSAAPAQTADAIFPEEEAAGANAAPVAAPLPLPALKPDKE